MPSISNPLQETPNLTLVSNGLFHLQLNLQQIISHYIFLLNVLLGIGCLNLLLFNHGLWMVKR